VFFRGVGGSDYRTMEGRGKGKIAVLSGGPRGERKRRGESVLLFRGRSGKEKGEKDPTADGKNLSTWREKEGGGKKEMSPRPVYREWARPRGGE